MTIKKKRKSIDENKTLESNVLAEKHCQKLEEREKTKTLKVHEKLTHSQKLIDGMKAGLKPDISDDDMGDDDDVNLQNIPSF